MNLIKAFYKKLKPVPVIGHFLVFIRNIPNWKIFLIPRLKKMDFNESVKVAKKILSEDSDVEELLNNFKNSSVFKSEYSFGHAGDFDVLMLYIITRITKPEVVLETGVASGRSSSAILLALKENKKGKLYSIDLPRYYEGDEPGLYKTEEGNSELNGFVPEGKTPGWIVPQDLRDRWELILGDSKVELPKLLEKLDGIDIFYHDSDHSYNFMMFEFENVWPKIKEKGFLVSDDIKWNKSFFDFMKSVKREPLHIYRNLGIIKK